MSGYGDYTMLIGGHKVLSAGRIAVVNPATEAVVAYAPDASRHDLDAAVASARSAFPGWSALPIDQRRDMLNAMGDRIFAAADTLKRLLTSEQGKPLADAEGEVLAAGYWLKATAALDLPVKIVEDSVERHIETRRVPLGVVGAIAPWNFPLLLAMFKVAPALLAGNSIVLKPSPFTPLSTLKFGEIVADLLPPGVLNILTGGEDLGP